MSEPIGFVIEYVVSDSDRYFHAIGRCGDRPIQVGDRFETIHAPAIILRGAYQGLGEASPVKLRVERIQAYQRQLDKLGEGMTGTVDLRGEGLDRVVPGAVLGAPTHPETEAESAREPSSHENPIV
jgi:hypothetical protein